MKLALAFILSLSPAFGDATQIILDAMRRDSIQQEKERDFYRQSQRDFYIMQERRAEQKREQEHEQKLLDQILESKRQSESTRIVTEDDFMPAEREK